MAIADPGIWDALHENTNIFKLLMPYSKDTAMSRTGATALIHGMISRPCECRQQARI